MERKEYKVEILHYINPHLIWVLVEDTHDKFHFEQIGIYGILPLNVEFDYDGNVTTTRCEKWIPAIFVAMKKILLEAKEVWFSVTVLEKTTSIFNDNIHKFGDLNIKMKDGKTVSMLQRLLDTGLVAEDVTSFQMNLNTELDNVNIVHVINKIKQSFTSINFPLKQLEGVLQTQTTIFSKTVGLETTLSPLNIDIDHHDNLEALLQKHNSNLDSCRDIDEVSVGRASNLRSIKKIDNSGLMKKLNLIEPNNDFSKLQLPPCAKTQDVSQKLDINQNEEKHVSRDNKTCSVPQNSKNKVSGIKSKQKVIDKQKKYIAFGPCGLSTKQYVLKEVKEVNKEPTEVKKIETLVTEDHDTVQQDMFDRADSEVNFKMTNTDHDKQNNEIDVKLPSALYRKIKILKEKMIKVTDSSSTTGTDRSQQSVQGDDSDSESITSLVDKLDVSNGSIKKQSAFEPELCIKTAMNNVNPFKNLDGSKSVFVEKLVSPSVMVHTKNGNCIQPVSDLRDIPFGTDIHVILRNLSVKKPMRPQTVTWPVILRQHSLFLVSPAESGKTLGYLPAVCRLVRDFKKMSEDLSVARLSCIIVCGTSYSVSYIEKLCKMFLHEANIFACYAGMTDIAITTTILNGCDILISTPCLLVRLLNDNLGINLRNLNTFVIDDCERVSEVYKNELKFCIFKVKEMLKMRRNKEHKVQYIVASRIWCSFMSTLALSAPDSVVCIGGFHECILYSKVDTTVEFLEKEKKLDAVIKFLQGIDKSKKTVVACRSDDEVHLIEKALSELKYVVFACDSTMTVQDLYNIDLSLSNYKEPLLGPILICCDGNLTHLNITDAHYLIHFSLPELFSLFCKRFAVLIDNYPSIFDKQVTDVKIKVLMENNNIEQLPKILNFIKRCSDNVPDVLDEISSTVMLDKDLIKARNFVPICNTLLTVGKCPDLWNCKHRHAIFKEIDEPIAWMPKSGIITFKILHFHTAVHYSARLMTCEDENGVKKFPQTYSMLSVRLGMYYSKEGNRKLHGIAKPGDVCAVSLSFNLYTRCQVIKIVKYNQRNHPTVLLINLIDEEKFECVSDTCLYHLPDELKNIETHVAKVVLSSLLPQDKDITYSRIIEDQLKRITEKNDDLYMRGQVVMAIGNCIFVDTLEACQDLTSLNETVVKNNFRMELLDGFAVNNPGHIETLEELGKDLPSLRRREDKTQIVAIPKPIKILPKARWAHLESNSYVPVYYLHAKSPELIFLQHVKFQDCLNILLRDIKKYVSDSPEPVGDVKVGDIVLAEFPDDARYERARIDNLIDGNKVKCFYVDLGDWRIVSVDKLLSITDKIITQLPFQAIECRLTGVKPLGDEWSEFSTNWLVDQFYNSNTDLKYLFAQRCTTEKAEYTEGDKYGVAIIDTYADDVCINKLMLDTNLAEESEEIELISSLNIATETKESPDEENSEEEDFNLTSECKDIIKATPKNTFKSYIDTEITADETENSLLLENVTSISNNALEPNKDNQIALNNAFQRPGKIVNEIDTTSTTSAGFSDKLHDNNQAIMNIFKNIPLRSVPLVDDDNFDDSKWDSPNALMFLNMNGSSEQANEPKIIPPKTNTEANNKNTATSNNVKEISELDAQKYTASTLGDVSQKAASTSKTTTADKLINVFAEKPIAEAKVSIKDDIETTVLTDNDKRTDVNWKVSTNNDVLLFHDEADRLKLEVTWSQDIRSVTIKILVTASEYELIVNDNEIRFYTNVNKGEYGFKLEPYGVVDVDKCYHKNKGSHVEVNLSKLMMKKWLYLYKGEVKKWFGSSDKKEITGDKKVEMVSNNQQAKSDINEASIKINKPKTITEVYDNLRKPKLVWRQNKIKATVKILLITDKYDLTIQDKCINFHAFANDEEYGFEFDLYGVVDVKKSTHTNKGQYIQIDLIKVMPKLWLILSVGVIKRWIVYDVDNIDLSSEEEVDSQDENLEAIRKTKFDNESDSDDEFEDDTDFRYKRSY